MQGKKLSCDMRNLKLYTVLPQQRFLDSMCAASRVLYLVKDATIREKCK